MAEAQEAASSGLFGVFLLSIYSLFLIPYTIYHLCSAGEESTTQPVARVCVLPCQVAKANHQSAAHPGSAFQGKKTAGFADRLKAWCTKGETRTRQTAWHEGQLMIQHVGFQLWGTGDLASFSHGSCPPQRAECDMQALFDSMLDVCQ